GTQSLVVIRILRLLRVFRVFKLSVYLEQGERLVEALRASRYKITVFLLSVLSLALIMGALMYLIEGEATGFTSIPRGMYWAIVTMTTVGYGDIAPGTVAGQIAASGLMILGYAILAVPTGIVSAELIRGNQTFRQSGQACLQCAAEGHDTDARYCKYCGAALEA
ncbi:MAG: ion transporter, partial [Deltaproteobacteria bacterium]|nr:ion transporter [Deltaproteobacteria bacterium]